MASTATASLGKFRITGKYIHRASIVALKMGEKADGTANIVNQPGPMELLAVGTELDDVQEHELKAFPDRFEPVDDTAKGTVKRLRGVPDDAPADEPVPAPTLGTPSSPAEKDEPPQPVVEDPAVVEARAQGARQATASRTAAPSATTPAPVGTHQPPATAGEAESGESHAGQRRRP